MLPEITLHAYLQEFSSNELPNGLLNLCCLKILQSKAHILLYIIIITA